MPRFEISFDADTWTPKTHVAILELAGPKGKVSADFVCSTLGLTRAQLRKSGLRPGRSYTEHAGRYWASDVLAQMHTEDLT